MLPVIIGSAGACFAALWIYEKLKNKELALKARVLEEKLVDFETTKAHLQEAEMALVELRARFQSMEESKKQIVDTFKALSYDALEKNNRSFMELAKASFEKLQEGAKNDLDKKQENIEKMFVPVKETLHRLQEGMHQIEKDRKGDQEALKHQIHSLLENEKQLRQETNNLVKALRAPIVRGRWGEIQLRRVVELAGMVNYCDFVEQETTISDEGSLRPDLIVKLPGGRQVIIDAKAPLEAYLDAIESGDEGVKIQKLKDHARHVRQHIQSLSKKAYWQSFQPTPEFVILFLPSEAFYSAALEQDPSLLELGAQNQVILATPTSLIALLRSVAYGWRQENLSEHIQKVSIMGQELYKRIIDLSSHFSKLGRSLSSSVEAYNKAVGSLELRVLSSARKFKDLGVITGDQELPVLETLDKATRKIESDELSALVSFDDSEENFS